MPEEPIERPTCETCAFWEWLQTRPVPDPDDYEVGECRRRPPTASRPSKLAGGKAMATWRRTFEDDWCGEHPDFPAYLLMRKAASW
jgi:hypothetical protein